MKSPEPSSTSWVLSGLSWEAGGSVALRLSEVLLVLASTFFLNSSGSVRIHLCAGDTPSGADACLTTKELI